MIWRVTEGKVSAVVSSSLAHAKLSLEDFNTGSTSGYTAQSVGLHSFLLFDKSE